jgi:hypothetical protein
MRLRGKFDNRTEVPEWGGPKLLVPMGDPLGIVHPVDPGRLARRAARLGNARDRHL